EWSDARVQALSAADRQHVKWILLAVGLIVAVIFNVDAVGAARQLYRDPALRTAIAQQATDLAKACDAQSGQASPGQTQPTPSASPIQCPPTDPNAVGGSLRFPVGWPRTENWGLTVLG